MCEITAQNESDNRPKRVSSEPNTLIYRTKPAWNQEYQNYKNQGTPRSFSLIFPQYQRFGQPKRAVVFVLRGLRPVCVRSYLRVLACQIRSTRAAGPRLSQGLKKAPRHSQPGHPRPNSDRLRRSDNPALQGRDEERALPVRTRNWCRAGRQKGRGLPGRAKGGCGALFQRYGLFRITKGELSGSSAALLRRTGYFGPSGA